MGGGEFRKRNVTESAVSQSGRARVKLQCCRRSERARQQEQNMLHNKDITQYIAYIKCILNFCGEKDEDEPEPKYEASRSCALLFT